jgi:hypothetical protein
MAYITKARCWPLMSERGCKTLWMLISKRTAYFTQELHHIDVKPVTHDPEFVVDYCMKPLKNRCSPDDIVVFPRTVSELPSTEPVRAAGEKPMYDFQRD